MTKATVTNLLEEELGVLTMGTATALDNSSGEDTLLKVKFRGFEVVTIKLIVEGPSAEFK